MVVRTHPNMREDRFSHVAIQLALATDTHRNMRTTNAIAESEYSRSYLFFFSLAGRSFLYAFESVDPFFRARSDASFFESINPFFFEHGRTPPFSNRLTLFFSSTVGHLLFRIGRFHFFRARSDGKEQEEKTRMGLIVIAIAILAVGWILFKAFSDGTTKKRDLRRRDSSRRDSWERFLFWRIFFLSFFLLLGVRGRHLSGGDACNEVELRLLGTGVRCDRELRGESAGWRCSSA